MKRPIYCFGLAIFTLGVFAGIGINQSFFFGMVFSFIAAIVITAEFKYIDKEESKKDVRVIMGRPLDGD